MELDDAPLGFQSTLPVRGATYVPPMPGLYMYISIHAPREGSDTFVVELAAEVQVFQSTLPVRGATGAETKGEQINWISIHAPREGSDRLYPRCVGPGRYFNPRSP